MTISLLSMPRLGETMENGIIVGWMVGIGERFERGQAILEIETDKMVAEVPALANGVLIEVLAEEGKVVEVGAVIARIDLEGSVVEPAYVGPEIHPVNPAVPSKQPPQPTVAGQSQGTRATPVARAFARQAGIDLASISGTGRRARIELGDVARRTDRQPDVVRFSQDIAYVESGPANGTPVLMIHGFAGDHTTFARLGNVLRKAGSQVVALDLPGHGATGIEVTSIDDLSCNLEAFAMDNFGDAPFHLIAHSIGAFPAAMLAERAQLASLTLIAPAGIGAPVDRAFLAALAEPVSAEDLALHLRMLTDQPSGLSEAAIHDIFLGLSKGRLRALASDLDGNGARTASILPALNRVKFRVPTRILVGHKDRVIRWQDAMALSPQIAVHHFQQAGHMPHWEDLRGVADIFLSGFVHGVST